MKKIISISPDLNLSENLIIVGSSGNIKEKNKGTLIDSYDTVVRFNRAPVFGYENTCGSKTDLRVMNNNVILNIDISNNDGGYSDQPKDFARDLRNQNILYIGPDIRAWEQRNNNIHSSNNLYLFYYQNLPTIKKQIGANFPRNLTVGAIFVCLCVLSGIQPTIYGFDFSGSIDRTHYWEKRPPQADNKSHNINGEIELLKRLIKEDRVKHLQ